MIRKILHSESSSITAGAVILVISSVAAKLLGLVRDRIFAGMFGAGDVLDAYYAAFRIPDLLYAVLMAGALSAAFIPVFVERRRQSDEVGWRLVNNVVGVGFTLVAALAAVLAVIAPALIDVVAPGFAGETRSLTITLTRIMFLSPVLLGLSSIASGVLQSLHRFVAYAAAPVLYNVGIIVGAVAFVPLWGPIGLAWGVVLGAALHFFVQLPSVWDAGFRLKPFLRPLTNGLRSIGRLMVPRTIGIAAYQVNLVVVTAIASTLAAGSITVFNFANNIHFLPVGAIGIPFATAAFPRLSAAFADMDTERFRRFLTETLREIFYIVVPLSVLLVVLREPVVRIILGTGAFGPDAVALTAAALALFAVSMITQAVVPLFARAFYARHNTKTPVVVSVVSMAANAVLAWLFVRWLGDGIAPFVQGMLGVTDLEAVGVLGLPIAFSLAGLLNAVVLAVLLRRQRGLFDGGSALRVLATTIGAALIGGAAAWWVASVIAGMMATTTATGALLHGGGAAVVGFAVYWGVTKAVGLPEASFSRLWEKIT